MEQPEGTKLRKALRWVATEMSRRPEANRRQLLEDAALRFDLDPRESELLFLQSPSREEEASDSGS